MAATDLDFVVVNIVINFTYIDPQLSITLSSTVRDKTKMENASSSEKVFENFSLLNLAKKKIEEIWINAIQDGKLSVLKELLVIQVS